MLKNISCFGEFASVFQIGTHCRMRCSLHELTNQMLSMVQNIIWATIKLPALGNGKFSLKKTSPTSFVIISLRIVA